MPSTVLFFRWPRPVKAIGLLLIAMLLSPSSAAGQPDWGAVEREAGQLLSRYIQIDTTNPPGNEVAAARFWQEQLAQEGIEAQVYESRPGRGIVVRPAQRQRRKKTAHSAPPYGRGAAEAEHWDFEPFSGLIKDGHVHGRGALDCKGTAVVQFLALALLKRHAIGLKRDIIFLGTGDEETGGQHGAGWFLDAHFERVQDAGFVLTEGGRDPS